MSNRPSEVAVLLCTYNGSRYLWDQLESIGHQEVGDWHLYVSDDGSVDDTLDILARWGKEAGDRFMGVRRGPGSGHAANFLSLVTAGDIAGDYFAFSDQDDIWDTDKLSRALAALERVPRELPALYCSRTRSVSAAGELLGESPLFLRPPSFANALLQNIAGGNTMVMNAAARELLCRGGAAEVVSHDWWTYLLITGAGGRVIYDPRPCLRYRQHGDNAIGANTGTRSRWNRYRAFLAGRNREWYTRNVSALHRCEFLLTDANRQVLAQFETAREGSVIERLLALRRSGVYAQTAQAQLGLVAATLLKKI